MPKTQTAKHRSTPIQPAPSPTQPAKRGSVPIDPALASPTLKLAAETLDDLEKVAIANANRLRQLTRSVEDSDGETRGLGLDVTHPSVARLAAIVEGLDNLTKEATKALEKEMRAHALGPWVKAQKGVGDKQAARLLAAIGDPYIRPELHRDDDTVEPSRPRLVSELWAYSGYHVLDSGVAPARRRGQLANWSDDARKRAWLITESIVKQRSVVCRDLGEHEKDCDCSPYRLLYETTKAHYADATHVHDCVRCGPSGKPAVAGSVLNPGHIEARARRAVSKEILKNLWKEARRLHGDDK